MSRNIIRLDFKSEQHKQFCKIIELELDHTFFKGKYRYLRKCHIYLCQETFDLVLEAPHELTPTQLRELPYHLINAVYENGHGYFTERPAKNRVSESK